MRSFNPFKPAIEFYRMYRVFHHYLGHRTLFLASLSLVTTLSESLGIAIFFTYIQQLTMGPGAPSSPQLQYLFSVFEKVGIPGTPIYIILCILAVFCLRGIFLIFTNGYQFYLFMTLTQKVTANLTGNFCRMNYRQYQENNVGFFTNLFTKDVNKTVLTYYQVSAQIAKLVSVLTYLAFSLRLEWRFTLIAICFGISTSIVFKKVTSLIKKHSQALTITEGKLANLVIQMVQSFKYLYATGNTRHLEKKVNRTSKDAAYYGSRMGFLGAIVPATSEPLIVAFISACFFYQTEVLKGNLTTLFISIMFLYRVMREATVMQGSWQTMMSFTGALNSVISTIDSLEKQRPKDGTKIVEEIRDGFAIKNLTFQYNQKPVLKNVTMHIKANSTVAFVGESGAGKSTLADIITGTLSPTSGSIFVDSTDYTDLNKSNFREKIGYVTQEGVLFDDTIANNISLWTHETIPNSEAAIWKALQLANCHDFVKDLPNGLNEMIGDRGIRLSGGQRQRLCIARELYKKINILLLDEATSALDSESEKLVQESIDNLKGKATIILIAHRLSTIKKCDYVYVFKAGEIAEHGTINELLKQNSYLSRMFQMQSIT